MESEKFTRKELYDLVWSTPLIRLAKMYAMSDNGLRKLCKRMNIPLPDSGYWAKAQHGKQVDKKKLPEDDSIDSEVKINLRDGSNNNKYSALLALEKEIIKKEGKYLNVPERLINPIDLVRNFMSNKEKIFKTYGGIVLPGIDNLSIHTTTEQQKRALRIIDSLVKIIQKRGHKFYHNNSSGTYIKVNNYDFQIYLREKVNRAINPEKDKWGNVVYNYTASGILIFTVKYSYQRKEVQEGKIPLEKKLAKIIAILEDWAEQNRLWNIEREKHRAEEEERKRIEAERRKRKEQEQTNFKELLSASKRLHETKMIRDYVDKYEAFKKANGKYTEDVQSWIIWARKKADWYDPFIEAYDEILVDEDSNEID